MLIIPKPIIMRKTLTTSLCTFLCALISIPILNAQIDFVANNFAANGVIDLYFADINGDGMTDISSSSYWWANNGDATFEQSYLQQIGFKIPIDMDADGDMDFVGEDYDNNLVWWEQSGSSFIKHVLENQASPNYFWELSLADFNGDGRMDFSVTFVQQVFNGNNYYTSWWENTGTDVVIKHPVSDSAKSYPFDIDGDGDMDLIGQKSNSAQRPQPNTVTWFENTGYGNFIPHLIYSSDEYPGSIQAGDFNGDGKGDIVFGRPFSVFWNDGNNNFTLSPISAANLEDIIIADLDNDGKDEIISQYAGLRYHQYNTTNSFAQFDLIPSVSLYNIADLDADGDIDIGYINPNDPTVRYLENVGTICPAGGIIEINAQSELVAFGNAYPDCDNLDATLLLSGSDITDLSPLSQFTTISSLRITYCDILMNLNGLNPDLQVTGTLYIAYNETLMNCNIEPLCNKIAADEENIELFNNAAQCFNLTNVLQFCGADCGIGDIYFEDDYTPSQFLAEFPNCKNVYGDVEIYSSDYSNLTFLSNIENIYGDLLLVGNSNITSLDGLQNLKYVKGRFVVSGSSSLTSLDGIENLKVGELFNVDSNPLLSDISALDHSIGNPNIFNFDNNPSVSNCTVEALCIYAYNPNAIIENNGANCSSPEAILANCSGYCPSADVVINNQADVDAFAAQYPYCQNLPVSLTIDNDFSLIDLSGLQVITSIEGDLIMESNASLRSLVGFENLTNIEGNLTIKSHTQLGSLDPLLSLANVGGDILIQSNSAIKNVNGFESLSAVGGSLTILKNGNLKNLDGLTNLTSISTDLLIQENLRLENIDGLENVTSVGNDLLVEENPALTNTDGLQNLETVGNVLKIFDNDKMTSVNLSALTSTGDLRLSGNGALYDITSLNHAMSINYLYFDYNTSLSYCAVQGVCDYLAVNNNYAMNINADGCEVSTTVDANCSSTDALVCSGGYASSVSDPDNIVLTMSPAPNTTGHIISVGSTPGGTDILENENIGGAATYTLSGLDYSTTYYLNIVGYSAFDVRTGCPEQTFTTGDAALPMCVTISSPVDGSVDNPLYSDLSWPALMGNPNYRVSLGTSAGGTDIINNADAGSMTSYSVPNLAAGTTYYASVTPYNATGSAATTCNEISFTTETIIVLDCVLFSIPTNNTSDVGIDIDLSWTAVSDATGYLLNMGTTSGGTDILNNVNSSGTNYVLPDLEYNTAYYLTITPFNAEGSALNCNEITFTTEGPPPTGCTNLLMPSNNAVNVPINTMITWNPVDNVYGYFISAGYASGGTDILNNVDAGNVQSYTLPSLNYNSQVYITITPYGESGDAMNCAEESFATALPPAPNCTTLSSPINMQEEVPVNTTLTWNPVSEANGYLVTIGTGSGSADIADNIDIANGNSFDPGLLEYETTYYITIVPYNEGGSSTGCTEEQFTTGSNPVPSCTQLSSPLNGATDVATNAVFMWDAVSDATGYLLSVGLIAGANDIMNNFDVGTATSFDMGTLGSAFTYYVTITPYNANGNAVNCVEESFTTIGTPTSVFFLSCQLDITQQVTNGETSATITWAEPTAETTCPVGTATISQDAGPANGSTFQAGQFETITYLAIDDCGNIAECTFVVGVELPLGCTTITNPTNNASNTTHEPQISWEEVIDADGYILTMGTTPTGNEVYDNVDVGLNDTFDAGTLDYNTTYYLTIIPYNNNGNAFGCETISFATAPYTEVTIDCFGTSTFQPLPGQDTLTVFWEVPIGTTTCPSGNYTIEQVFGDLNGTNLFVGYEGSVVYAITDECGNYDDCTYIIQVVENPVQWYPECPENVIVSTSDANGIVVSYADPFMETNCVDGTSSIDQTSGLSSGSMFPVGTTLNEFNLSLSCNGEPYNASCNFNVTVNYTPNTVNCTQLVDPINDQINVNTDITLLWNIVGGADGYLVSIGTTPSGSELFDNFDNGNVNSFDPGVLELNTTYYVRITPYDDNGNAIGCTEESFTTEQEQSVITVTCQENETYEVVQGTSNSIFVTWDEPIVSTTCPSGIYTIQQLSGPQNGTSLNVPGGFSVVYRITDECGGVEICDFVIGAVYVPLEFSTTCASGMTVETTDPNGIIVDYVVPTVNTNCTQGVISVNQTTGLPTGSFFPLGENPQYYELSLNCYGQVSQDDCLFFINVYYVPPCTNLTSPVNGATNVPINSTLSWNPSLEAVGYNLSVGTTAGGVDILENFDVGNVTTYDLGELAYGTEYFVKIVPYHFRREAVDCIEESFTTVAPFEFNISCMNDMVIEASTEAGEIAVFNEPTINTNCTQGNSSITQIAGLPSGTLFPEGVTTIEYEVTLDCNGTTYAETCSFNVTINYNPSDCPDAIPGFTALGEFDNHKYFISDSQSTWMNASATAASNDAYLVSINDAAENEFIRSMIGNNIVFIGLNDANTEGNYVWDSGEPLTYNFIETPSSDLAEDFANMNFWSGGWAFDNQWVQRRYIIETTCGPVATSLTVECPTNVNVNIPLDQTSAIVTYDLPTYLTSCASNENVVVNLISGMTSGSAFNVGTTDIVYEVELTCGDEILTEMCQFSVTVEQSEVNCVEEIAGFSFLGTYNDHNYFLSDNIQSWPNAAMTAAANDGYLVSMNDANENEFVRSQIGNNIVFIGLSDAQSEGNYQWQSGAPVDFNFIETAGTNPDEDYANMNFWSGGWAFDISYVQRRFVMEVECGPQAPQMTVNCPLDQIFIAESGETGAPVNWSIPTATTTCADPNITYTQVAGALNGSTILVDQPQMISYEISDACGNIEVCSFSVTLESTSATLNVNCPDNQVYIADPGATSGIVNWNDVTATTTCATQSITYSQLSGPSNGSIFQVDQPELISFEVTDLCGNIGTCSFTVTLASVSATLAINCPQDQIFIANPGETSAIVSWQNPTATTTCPGSNITYTQINGPANGSLFQVDQSQTITYEIADDCGNIQSCSFNITLSATSATLNVNCPSDQVFSVPAGQGSMAVTWQVPTATTDCPSQNTTSTLMSNVANGSIFQDGQTETIIYELADECGNAQTCSFTVSLLAPSTECPDAITGFDYMGELNGHKYFKALQPKIWMEAQQIASDYGGYLVSINSEEENEFIRNNISVITMIGLNDVENEGTLIWDSGEPVGYNFVETANDAEGDFGAINFWNGGWLFINQWVQKPYIIEFACQPAGPILSVECIDDIVMTADPGVSSMAINWELPFASTTCPDGLITTTQLTGSGSGALYNVGDAELITYEFEDECGNVESCSFNVALNAFALTFDVDCPQDILLSVDEGTSGAIVNFDNPMVFSNCPNVPNVTITQTAGAASGSFYPVGTSLVSFDIEMDCNGGEVFIQQCAFNITIEENSANCPDQLADFEFLGEFGSHHYFLAQNPSTWAYAHNVAENLGAYLVSITSFEENEFLRSNISDIVMTGLHDQNVEGQFEWDSGEPFDYSYVTDGNLADSDFGTINFWNGGWGTVNQWVQKPYIIEFSCGNTPQARMNFGNEISINNIFPNPTSSQITIDVESTFRNSTTVQIFDVFGKLKMELPIELREGSMRTSLDVNELDAGIHFVRIKGNDARSKFIKINQDSVFD